ncbi:MAG: alpha/beta hydrolase [bacterium]|nr:alpha/beta hydrolase [Gammaproteobacteria bacterium]HIL98226.1 alpha/beta hydrolase [Pseudomonadales bacterium]
MNDFDKARPTSHSYFSQRLRLHYLDWGNESAPHVLLIHGVQDHCHSWDWVSHDLCPDYHLVVPDLRGHGDSEWVKGSAYTNLDYVYDLAQLIHQENLEPVNIIAHSMGGTIASLLAGVYPEKVASLISVEGVGGTPMWYREDRHPQQILREWIDSTRALAGRTPKRYTSQSDAFQRMQKSNPHLDQEQARHLTVHGSNRNEDGTYTWKFDNYTHSRGPYGHTFEDMTRLWEKITCPTLLINARQGYDSRIGQNDTLKHFRHGELVGIDNAGHWLHHDQFDEFVSLTRTFLSKHAN